MNFLGDQLNGATSFVGRVIRDGEIKLSIFVPQDSFLPGSDILCSPPSMHLTWKWSLFGKIEEGAVSAGKDSNGQTVYIGRR